MGERSPRYLDVAVVLENEIGTLAPNSLPPTEHQLARRFGVGRIPVRGAPREVSAAPGIAPRTLVPANIHCGHLADGTPGEAGAISHRIDRGKFRYQVSFDRGTAGSPGGG